MHAPAAPLCRNPPMSRSASTARRWLLKSWFPPWRWPPPWRPPPPPRRRLIRNARSRWWCRIRPAARSTAWRASTPSSSPGLGQSVVVENRAGASGMIGAAYVARAAPDGYTLYLNASIHAINPLLYKRDHQVRRSQGFHAHQRTGARRADLQHQPQVPANNVQELVKTLKADPQKYSFATTGFGSAGHLAAASPARERPEPDPDRAVSAAARRCRT